MPLSCRDSIILFLSSVIATPPVWIWFVGERECNGSDFQIENDRAISMVSFALRAALSSTTCSTGAAEAHFLGFHQCWAAARSTRALCLWQCLTMKLLRPLFSFIVAIALGAAMSAQD